ncbi:PREDICTED: uncharacterized protein LOC106740876 [Dinoponera quadriceps]|uniref:Uncharacterized protein LOC106740876 n=1 Tax=Dinoponera quadriceps TaxID=609295 RepID=A0A6P3WPY7_DINQU|nr:PREDICTED: uncharacterized protein LOC106740876 [Dinoponera quadriceps]
MKLLISLLALSCAIAYTSAGLSRSQEPSQSTGPVLPHTPRFPRAADPGQNNSISIIVTQPMSGPHRQPSIGLQYERNFGRNGFITGSGQIQPGSHNLSPTFGIGAGYRFKREADPEQNSISIIATQPMSGPHRRPSIGLQYERNFGKNGFITGSGQIQPGSHNLSPTFGIGAGFRFKREADPQRNSINFQGTQPLSGPNRQPTWDLNFNRNLANNGRTSADIFGGVSKVPGQRAQPHVGIQAERNFGNDGFIRGNGQLQPGPRGRLSPSIGISGGFRFKREADPQRNSINFQGTQPLSGPNRQPTWDLNFNRNLANNGRTSADIFGGVSKVPGQRAQPHVGVQVERNFGNNGFIRGNGQVQPGPGGRLSPSVGITGGFRFRREAEDAEDDAELIEEY